MNINSPAIRIGLLTEGCPEIERAVRHGMPGHFISNLRIGHGFHWQAGCKAFFPGELDFLPAPQDAIHVVNKVPVEVYILSVISSEMNPEAPLEFLKAHAVISRSWAMRKMIHDTENKKVNKGADCYGLTWEGTDAHVGFDVCSDDHCQRYQGFGERIPESALTAVESTKGEVLIDSEGEIADARFSKCCGGRTELFSSCWEDRDFDYLISKPDPWCNLENLAEEEKDAFLMRVLKTYDVTTQDFYSWQREVGKQWLRERILRLKGEDLGEIIAIEPLRLGLSGRIVSLKIIGTNGEIVIGKELAIRRLLAEDCLYSSWFEIEDLGERFLLKGHGWGHGVGLCQIGAAHMALEGKTYREILQFYYPGTHLARI